MRGRYQRLNMSNIMRKGRSRDLWVFQWKRRQRQNSNEIENFLLSTSSGKAWIVKWQTSACSFRKLLAREPYSVLTAKIHANLATARTTSKWKNVKIIPFNQIELKRIEWTHFPSVINLRLRALLLKWKGCCRKWLNHCLNVLQSTSWFPMRPPLCRFAGEISP